MASYSALPEPMLAPLRSAAYQVKPVHLPTKAESNSHLVQPVNADGMLQVLDATTNAPRTMRLAVLAVSGQLTLVAGGDA